MVSFSGVSSLSTQLPILVLVPCLALNREYFHPYPMFAFNVGLDIVTLNDVNHEHLSFKQRDFDIVTLNDVNLEHLSFKQRDFYPIHLILTVVGYYYFNIYINKVIKR